MMPAKTPIRLRGHHFLCMLTYKGMGYSAEFTANMTAKINEIKNGTPVILIEGPDDICAGLSKACSNATGHDCKMPDTLAMDATARKAVEAVLNRDLATALPVTAVELDGLRAAFAGGSIRAACAGCSWFEICNQIVSGKFAGTQLLGVSM